MEATQIKMLGPEDWGRQCINTWLQPNETCVGEECLTAALWHEFIEEYTTNNCLGNCFASMYLHVSKSTANAINNATRVDGDCFPLKYVRAGT